MIFINDADAESTPYRLQENRILQTPCQTLRNVNQRTWSQTWAALARFTQTTAIASARQGLDHLLNIMSPLLEDAMQPIIHKDDSDNKSILNNITDAELDKSRLNSSTLNQTNKPHTNYLTKLSTNLTHHQ